MSNLTFERIQSEYVILANRARIWNRIALKSNRVDLFKIAVEANKNIARWSYKYVFYNKTCKWCDKFTR